MLALAIKASGMVTAVGFNAPASLAAMRGHPQPERDKPLGRGVGDISGRRQGPAAPLVGRTG